MASSRYEYVKKKNIYIYIKPLKSEVIHETGLSGNVVASFFPLIIFNIYIYIYIYIYIFIYNHSNFLTVLYKKH